jgi:hypothetical protein
MRRFRWTGLVQRRMGADRTIVAMAFLVITVAVTVLVAATAFPAVASRQGAVRALQAADRLASSISLTVDVPPAGVGTADQRVRSVFAEALGALSGTVVASGRSESYGLAGATGDYPPLTKFAFLDGLATHATLISGAWPVDGGPGRTLQVVVTEAAATQLAVAAGTTLSLVSRIEPARHISVLVVGIVALPDRSDPVWGADPLLLDGIRAEGPFTTIGPLFTGRDGMLAQTVVASATMTWTAIPLFERLAPAAMSGLSASVASIPGRMTAALGHEQSIAVRTDLPALLAGVGDGLAQAGTSSAVAAGQLLVLAGYALLFVAALVVERRRASWRLLVARGATGGDAVFLALVEAVALAIPAMVIGLPAGAGVALLAAGGGSASGATVTAIADLAGILALVAAGTAVVAVAGFVAPVLVSVGPISRLRRTVARRRTSARVSRSGADLALLAVAVLGLRQLGAAPSAGSLGLSPLDVAAPAIALIAGAILSVRLTPLVARGVAALLRRSRSPAGGLAGNSIERRSGAHARPVLLLVAAAGIAVFCVQFARAWDASQRDQIAFAVAADIAGAVPGTAGAVAAWPSRGTYLAIPGVTGAAPVIRDTIDAGPSLHAGHLLAVPAGVALPQRAVADDAAARLLADNVAALAAARPSLPLLALPSGTTRVRVTVFTGLVPADGTGGSAGTQAGGPGLAVALVVQEADGTLSRIGPEAAEVHQARRGSSSTLIVTLRAASGGAAAGPADPVRVVAVEIDVTPAGGAPLTGNVSLTGIDATADATGDASWSATDLASVIGAWGVTRTSFGVQAEPLESVAGVPGSGQIASSRPVSRPGVTTLAFRPNDLAGLGRKAIAAIADGALLEAGSASVGDTLTVRMGLTDTRRLQAGMTASTFPGLDGSGFAVVDLGTWQLVGYGQSGAVPPPTGWRLTTDAATDAATDEAAVLALETGTYRLVDVRSRAAETRARLADPIAMSILGTLAIVAVAALVFAILGVLAASWAAGRVRRGEVATLLALGLERRGLLILVLLEEAFPLAAGLAGGVALGASLGIAVLPAMIRAPGGAAPIPAPVATVPWDLVGALAVAGVLLVAAASLARTRAFGTMDLADTIRNDAPGAQR